MLSCGAQILGRGVLPLEMLLSLVAQELTRGCIV